MYKDFDSWNIKKKQIDQKDTIIYCHPREIWWATLGINIGIETNGKNKNFERPVLIMRVYNRHSILILPLTTKTKDNKFHFVFNNGKIKSCAILSQTRAISTKRLTRKISNIEPIVFDKLEHKWEKLL